MSRRYSEIIFLACILIGVFVFWLSANDLPASPRYAQVDADMWPRMILAALAVTTSLLLTQRIAAVWSGAAPIGPTIDNWPYFMRLASISLLIVLYYFGLQYIGFFFATLVFVWVASNILPMASMLAKILFAPIFTLALGMFFTRALSLPLPRGQGVFYSFSTMLF